MQRNRVLDFIKGCSVAGMLVHHSLNYFPADRPLKLYVRFVSGIFLFLAGYLINSVLNERHKNDRVKHAIKMIVRGIKLPAICIILNVILIVVISRGNVTGSGMLQVVVKALTVGLYRGVAFDLLIAIGYTIIIVSIIRLTEKWRIVTWISAFALVICCSVFFPHMSGGYNARYVAIGILGAAVGTIHTRLELFLKKKWWIIVASFAAYAVFLPMVRMTYPLYVVVVVVNFLMLYCIGIVAQKLSVVFNEVAFWGQYSLFAYLFQIFLFQLYRIVLPVGSQNVLVAFLTVSFFTLIGLHVISVLRKKINAVEKLYAITFR